MLKLLFSLIAYFFVLVNFTYAQKGPPDKFASFGALVIHGQSPYRGLDNKTSVVPILTAKYNRVFFFGTQLNWNLLNNKYLNLGAYISPELFSGYEGSDATELNGMDDRKGGIDSGINGRFRLSFLRLKFRWGKDIIGRHGGQTGEIGLGTNIPLSVFINKIFGSDIPFIMLELSYIFNYSDSTFNNYFYGVQSHEVTVQREQYSTRESWSPSFKIGFRANIVENIVLNASYQKEHLASEIELSSIVDKSVLDQYMIGLSYQYIF